MAVNEEGSKPASNGSFVVLLIKRFISMYSIRSKWMSNVCFLVLVWFVLFLGQRTNYTWGEDCCSVFCSGLLVCFRPQIAKQ